MKYALREWLITLGVFAFLCVAVLVVVEWRDDDPPTECETVTEYDGEGRAVRSTMVCK